MTNKLLTAAALAAGSLLWAGTASAVPIAAGSLLSINGQNTFTPSSITFLNPANLGAGTGSFSVFTPAAGVVTMNMTTMTSTSTGLLFTATEGTNTSTLSVNAGEAFTFTPAGGGNPLDSLDIKGSGTLTMTGFDPTPGNFDITTQGLVGATVTFSATDTAGAAVPEPASLAILGSALAGLGVIRRRRRKSV